MRLFSVALVLLSLSGCVTKGSGRMSDLKGDACDPFFDRAKACMPETAKKDESRYAR